MHFFQRYISNPRHYPDLPDLPDLPDFARLAVLGVKRISMGNCVHSQLQDWLRHTFQAIQSQQSFDTVFAHASH